MNIYIEKLQLNDIAIVKDLLSKTWKDTYTFLSSETIDRVTSQWHTTETLERQSQNPEVYFAVAKTEAREIVGLVTIWKQAKDTVFMSRLYVDPRFQRQGIGKLLFEAGVRYFPDIKVITLEVEKLNEKGKQFYLQQGFTILSEKVEEIGKDTLEVLVMEKNL